MSQLTPLASIDLHDATLDEISVEWHTGTCVMRLRCVGPDGGRPVEVRWHGLVEIHVDRLAPWGPSSSVLEARSLSDGTDEIAMQSGDVIRVRGAGTTVTPDRESVASRYGALVADALVDAGLVEQAAVAAAAGIAAAEIRARRGLGDV